MNDPERDYNEVNMRMDTFCALFQDIEEAVKELKDFERKVNTEYKRRKALIPNSVEGLNALERYKKTVEKEYELEWWRTREIFNFLYRLAMKYHMFPQARGISPGFDIMKKKQEV